MLNKFKLLLKAGVGIAGCVAAIGAAQAATTLTAIDSIGHNTSWQNIASASYSVKDTNLDGKLDAGDVLTFNIDMHKNFWGMHAFDALKVWIGDKVYTGQWDFSDSSTQGNTTYEGTGGGAYPGPNKSFSFNYTATQAGPIDIFASVMCNDDLSGLNLLDGGTTGSLGIPTDLDKNAWIYGVSRAQGEDKRYTVTQVPEAETYAMLLVGLGLLGFTARRRKDYTA